jgi:hypothetical protein
MKRKLIDYDSFEKIKLESLTNVHAELEQAAEIFAETVGVDSLRVESYNTKNVLFESEEGELIKADYTVGDGYVQFDNIEQVVLNEAAENEKAHDVISKMIDSLIESNEANASEMLNEWLGMPRNKRVLNENVRGKKQPAWLVNLRSKKKKLNRKKKSSAELSRNKSMRSKVKVGSSERRVPVRKTKGGVQTIVGWSKRKKTGVDKKHMKEWHILAENVMNFVDYSVNGPEVDCKVLRKEGEIVSVRVPTMKVRNEAKMLRFDWKTMNTDVVIKRNSGKKLAENSEFVKSILGLKRLNALSDSRAFEEGVERTAANFPSVIYLTESELAAIVKKSLTRSGATNFDDETCGFLAEALIRTVHENYVDTVSKIVKLAGSKINEKAADKYAEFKTVAEAYYSRLDEQSALEMQAFVDVYEALRQIHEVAKQEEDSDLAEFASMYLDELLPIVSGKEEMDLDTLGEAAEWLYDVVEASNPENWEVDSPVVRYDGEHPDLLKKGRHSQSPADMQGNTPTQHHVSDGKEVQGSAAKELANDGWSNIGGEGVYPSLENPYVPGAQVPKIVGEKDVDSDSDQLAHWGDNDTWPNLQNPYVKPSIKPEMKE